MEVLNTQPSGQPAVNLVRAGARIGVLNGIIALVLMFGSYYMGLDTFVNVEFVSLFVPYMFIILIVYGLQLRKRNGGLLQFKEGLRYAFMSYVVTAVLIAVGTYILFVVMDKGLTQRAFDVRVIKTRSFMQSLHASQSDIDKEMEAMGANQPQHTDFKNIFLGFGQGLIWDFIKSALVALIIRREKRAL